MVDRMIDDRLQAAVHARRRAIHRRPRLKKKAPSCEATGPSAPGIDAWEYRRQRASGCTESHFTSSTPRCAFHTNKRGGRYVNLRVGSACQSAGTRSLHKMT